MKTTIFWFALIAAILATYWPASQGAFIWDDVDLIRDNPLITSPAGLRLIWTSKEAVDFWPIANSLYWLEWRLWGENTLAFHTVNVVLHILNCFLLSRILKRLAVPFTYAIVALFALHPMNVEAVAWIFQQKTLLSTTFVLASALVFLRGNVAVSVLLFVAALMTKISVVMWPVVLALYVFTETKSVRAMAKRTAAFFVPSLVFGILNLTWYPYGVLSPADAIHDLSIVERFLVMARATFFYVYKAMTPFPVSFVYPRWEVSASDVTSWFAFVGFVVVAAFMIFRAWRGSAVVRGILAHWILMFPALGLFTIFFQRYSWVADHWHYLALPILLATFVVAIGSQIPKKIGVVVVGVLLVAYAVISFDHAKDFRGPEAIWSHSIEDNPASFLAHNNLGHIQQETGRLQEAEASFKRALEAKPDYRESLSNLGRLYKNAGRFDEAEAMYLKAIEVSPKFVSAHVNIGALYGTVGKNDEAKRAFEKALELDPEAAFVHFNLAALYQQMGDRNATFRELGLANKVSGMTAYKYGNFEKAKEFLTAASQHLPGDPEIRSRLEELSR